ncbi:hypothetical protein [Hydrogenovibrio halophilus]|uniref:hypothetical protein n=1 Tax=Hydrogenovibrio halophilus TaxID=373391 RepID=UPI000363E19D|nr:hypothetical protein [Hydrogenovibrio halophilus]
MSQEKQLEQEIGWYKVVFAVLAAIDVSLLAWFAQNYESQSTVLLTTCFIAIIFVSIGIALINFNVFRCLKKLKDL